MYIPKLKICMKEIMMHHGQLIQILNMYSWTLGLQGTCKEKGLHFPCQTTTTFEIKGQL